MAVKSPEAVAKPLQISIANQFSRFPAGRYVADGPFSGQAFREKLLVPAMRSGKDVVVNLDGTSGFGSSFLEEAFGGLVRQGFGAEDVIRRMKFKCSDPSIIEEITDYIRKAQDGQRA